jgi:hypothetical protein
LLAPVDSSRGDELPTKLAELDPRLSGRRHGIGRIFWEAAQADLAASSSTHAFPSTAAAVVTGVLPRYFAAIAAPAPQAASSPPASDPATSSAAPESGAPVVTVTLIRWPYT